MQTEISLNELLGRLRAPPEDGNGESRADELLLRGKFEAAVEIYLGCGDSARVKEKRAWCYGQLEDWSTVSGQLAGLEPELSSRGLALLAVACADGWGKIFGAADEVKWRVKALIRQSLERESVPPGYVYAVLFEFCRALDFDDLGELMTNAVAQYPTVPYFRLRWAYQQKSALPSVEIYNGLLSCLSDKVSDEYFWACATAALRAHLPTKAAEHLATLDGRCAASKTDIATVVWIRLLRAHAVLEAGDHSEARTLYAAIEDDSREYEAAIRLELCRHRVRLEVRSGTEAATGNAVAQLVDTWLEDANDLEPMVVIDGESMPIWFSDGTIGSAEPAPSLAPHKELLLKCGGGEWRGLLRYLLAESLRRYTEDYDRRAYVDEIGQARKESRSPHTDGAYAMVCVLRTKKNWETAGRAWARYAHFACKNDITNGFDEPIELVEPSDKDLLTYARGMLGEYERISNSDGLHAVFAESLRDKLVAAKHYDMFRRLAVACRDASNVSSMFDAGLGAHWCNDYEEAVSQYSKVLEVNPVHYSALFNLLLLCHGPSMRPLVDRAESLITTFPGEKVSEKENLLRLLGEAKTRCIDPEAVKRDVVRQELSRYPRLVTVAPRASQLPLAHAVALLSLLSASSSPKGALIREPFGNAVTHFSPTQKHRQLLFELLRSGIVAIAGETPLQAFSIEKESIRAYYFDRVFWETSPATLVLANEIVEVAARSRWPKLWCREVPGLAYSIVVEECIQYIKHSADIRGWPAPDDDAKVDGLAQALIKHVSVCEAYYLIYLGGMSAADYKAQKPINAQQAANAIVLRTSQKLDRWIADPWPLKQFSRTDKVPRSWLSTTLFDDLLKVGDRCFNGRIDRLTMPLYRGQSTPS